MKKFYILALMLLASVSAIAQNGRTLYNKYSDLPDVEAVYISPAMFKMIGKLPEVRILSGLYILNIPKSEAAAQLADEVNRFVTKGHYELLMEAKDNGEVMRMYTAGDDKIVNSFIMLSHDASETSFICLDGAMPREQLEALIADAAKD